MGNREDSQIYIAHAPVNVVDPVEQRHAPAPDPEDKDIVEGEHL